jgi:hypothetical protein
MERLTNWHCAIMIGFQVNGVVQSIGIPMEIAVNPVEFTEEICKREIECSKGWDFRAEVYALMEF